MSDALDFSEPLLVAGGSFKLASLGAVDLSTLVAIEQRSHPHPWTEQNFKSSLESHVSIGLMYEEQCIGYAIFSFVVGEAELLLFVLDKPWQGRGIAKAFLQRALDCARSRARTVFLEVRKSNEVAIGLYDSLGFNQVGIRPNYYRGSNGRSEDALLLALELLALELI